MANDAQCRVDTPVTSPVKGPNAAPDSDWFKSRTVFRDGNQEAARGTRHVDHLHGEAPDTVTPDSHDIGIPRDTQGDVARAAGYLLVKPVMPRVTQTETKAAH